MIRKDDIINEDIAHVPGVGEEQPIEMTEDAQKTEKELEKIAAVDQSKAVKTKNTSKNFAFTLLFIAVNVLAVVLTLLLEFKNGEAPVPFSQVWRTYIDNFWWLIGAFAMFILFNACEAIKRRIFLKTTLNKDLPLISMNATLLCKYYDSITPLGSGGQPFEIYYLRKKGIPLGVASGVPIVSYALDRIAYVIIALFVMIFHGFGDIGTVLIVLCIFGLLINAFIPFALVFFILLPKTAEKVARFVAKVGKFLHLVKDVDLLTHKLTDNLKEYADCIKYFLKKSKVRMLLGILLSVLAYVVLYSIPFFTIKMSGATGIRWGEIFALTVICYTSVTMLPTPGNSGGAELSFRSIFAKYLSGGKLFWGIMSWRICSYYLSIFVGIILIIFQSLYRFTKRSKKERERAFKAFEESIIRPKAAHDDVSEEGKPICAQEADNKAESVIAQENVAESEERSADAIDNAARMAEEGHYGGVVTPAPVITIHDSDDSKVVTTEAIIPEPGSKSTEIEHVVTAESAESVIHVKAVILPKEGIQITEISGDDNDDSVLGLDETTDEKSQDAPKEEQANADTSSSDKKDKK